MKAIVAIGLALLFLLPAGCSKTAIKKDEPKLEEPKNHEEKELGTRIDGSESPPWSKFPMPEVNEEDKEKEEK